MLSPSAFAFYGLILVVVAMALVCLMTRHAQRPVASHYFAPLILSLTH